VTPTGNTVDTAVCLTANSTSDDQNPAFSPDGKGILFSSKRNGNGKNLNIWRMDITGKNLIALTNEPISDNVNMPGSSWSGARNKIAFSSDRTGNDEIWIMNADGSNPVQLTNNPAKDWEPTFSPDGTKIAFESDRSGNLDIWLINSPVSSVSLNSVNDFVYQLQNIDLTAIGNTKFDLVIIDYSQDGSDENRFTAEQISALKNSPGGPKLVLAYMSIGEAENYRWYWDNKWDADNDGNPDLGAPLRN
jgi:dipeptidyl aminopeptidase/acylaminoacyl peptidase